MNSRIAIALLALAFVIWGTTAKTPVPAPPAPPSGALNLVGAFQGVTAADDAATLAAMADEIASVIEWDGKQESPLLSTGRALDAMRTRTREFMCRGESLGDRHPRMRQIVGDYLMVMLGTSGNAVTEEQRAEWVKAYREVARAARHAISQ
jgi:hypothetical protein